ncbi:anti-sigma regulatory factor [Pseudaquabacterium rugosum]|uniref:Anti-sigma regulatory factor n=1 Tax=Pseudaquabacterium rugosum TaxID=2984194 RepID=A0ABU9B842_9BURK
MTNSHRVELHGSPDLLRARTLARQLASAAGLGVMDQTRFATAVSELCRNALTHAHDGVCTLDERSDAGLIVLQVTVEDRGPGIADVARALEDGYSSSGSLGVGLPGTRRLMDHFELHSDTGGTHVCAQMRRRRRMA